MGAKSNPESSDSQKKLSERDRLPFEPSKRRKQAEQKAPLKSPVTSKLQTSSEAPVGSKESMAIPDVVSRRMIRRMALLCGIPTALGISTFFVSYFIVINDLFALPNSAVVLVSMAFFGLGVLGLSYGVLSASWDEESPGSLLGWEEFMTNFGRLTAAWRSPR
jgi:hypothetical protein